MTVNNSMVRTNAANRAQELLMATIGRNTDNDCDNAWGHTETGLVAKQAAMSMLSTKTGLYAKVPLICKQDDCPYKDACPLLDYALAPAGEPCPWEAAQIELRTNSYYSDFRIDESTSFVDKFLTSELVTIEILIERAKMIMSRKEQDLVQMVSVGVNEDGNEIKKPEVSQYLGIYQRLLKEHNNLYQLMMATRRDKASLKGRGSDDEENIHDVLAEVMDPDFAVVEEVPEQFKKEGEST